MVPASNCPKFFSIALLRPDFTHCKDISRKRTPAASLPRFCIIRSWMLLNISSKSTICAFRPNLSAAKSAPASRPHKISSQYRASHSRLNPSEQFPPPDATFIRRFSISGFHAFKKRLMIKPCAATRRTRHCVSTNDWRAVAVCQPLHAFTYPCEFSEGGQNPLTEARLAWKFCGFIQRTGRVQNRLDASATQLYVISQTHEHPFITTNITTTAT